MNFQGFNKKYGSEGPGINKHYHNTQKQFDFNNYGKKQVVNPLFSAGVPFLGGLVTGAIFSTAFKNNQQSYPTPIYAPYTPYSAYPYPVPLYPPYPSYRNK